MKRSIHNVNSDTTLTRHSCAQVKVVEGGSGVPGPTTKIPGVYKVNDPEVNFSLWSGYKPYTMPGPAVWAGGNSGAPAAGNETTTPPPTDAPVNSTAPDAGTAAVAHNAENCNGGKLARTRRAFRDMLLAL